MMKFGLSWPDYVWSFTSCVAVFFCVFAGRGYSAEALEKFRTALSSAISALFIAFLFTIFLTVVMKTSGEISRIWVGSSVLATAALMIVLRIMIRSAVKRTFQGRAWSRLFISDGIDIAVPAGVCRFDASGIALLEGGMHPVILDEIGRRVQGYDSVIVYALPERRRAWANALQGCDVSAHILVPELEELGSLGMERFNGIPMVVASVGPLKVRSEFTKRALDLAIAIPLLLFLLPLMTITAIAIKLDTPGPILFRQQRVGRGNRLFNVLKFRSMRDELSDTTGSRSAGRDDNRITRVGRFIRSTSIDEFPQLFNILRGEMSLVGPRPHALGSLAGDELFWEVDQRYHFRHVCKPGLTGLAQVRGFRGATERREDLVQRLDADLEYRSNWSVWRDVGILFATLKVVVHKNAY